MKNKLFFIPAVAFAISLVACGKQTPSTPVDPAIKLESIQVVSIGKDTYELNEELVKPTVSATFSNKSVKTVTNECVFTGFDSSTSGTKTVDVSYTYEQITKHTSFTVTVNPGHETKTYTIDMNERTHGTGNSDGVEHFCTVLQGYFNQEANLLDSISADGYSQINTFTFANGSDLRTLICGSNKKDGTLVLNFTQTLVSMKIIAQTYYSSYMDTWTDPEHPKEICNSDQNANITVNDELWNMTATATGEVPLIENKTFTLNSKSISLKGVAGHRTMIRGFEITLAE